MSSTPGEPEHPGAAPAGPYLAGSGAATVLVGTAVVVLAQVYAAIPLLSPVGRTLGGDVTFALSTCFGLCYAIGFVLWATLADQYGRRPILLIGVCLLVFATIACALASSIPMLALLRGTQGLAASSFAPAALAYLSEALPPARRPVAIGAMSTAFLVAGIIGQVGAQAISLTLGWPWVFVTSAALLTMSVVGIVVLVRESAPPIATGTLGHRFSVIGRVALSPSVLWLCMAHLTLLLSFVAMYTALGPHLTTFGLDSSQVIWVRLVGLPGMFAALAVGPLSRHWGVAGVARLGFLAAAVGIGLQAVLASSLVGIAAASLVFVIGVALAIPTMITLFGDAAAPQRAGGMAINGLMLFTGASLGPLLATAGLSFGTLLLVLVAALTLAAGCVTLSARLATGGAR